MTVLHLIRHGETDWNREKRLQGQSDSQLTDAGRAQAREAGKLLQDTNFDCAFTSSNRRALDTAELILEHHDIPLYTRDALREIHLGPWESRRYEDIQRSDSVQFGYFWNDPSRFSLDGAEDFFQLQQRAVETVTAIAREHSGKSILLVSHGAFLKSLLCHIEQRPFSRLWQPPGLHNCSHSIITWHGDDAGFEIDRYAGLSVW